MRAFNAAASCASFALVSAEAPFDFSSSGVTTRAPDGSATAWFGLIPWCQIWRPFGVSHSTVPTSTAEPSERSNSFSTVPVPNVVCPNTWPRPASWIAPATISAALAVPRLTRTANGRFDARSPLWTLIARVLPVASRSW